MFILAPALCFALIYLTTYIAFDLGSNFVRYIGMLPFVKVESLKYRRRRLNTFSAAMGIAVVFYIFFWS